MINKIELRLSNRGVPHTLVTVDNVKYSICWFGKSNVYRVWEYESQRKVGDIQLLSGNVIDLELYIRQLNLYSQVRMHEESCRGCSGLYVSGDALSGNCTCVPKYKFI